ncbi:MAG: HNH endonuclease [Planctomycetes bacterium]|nr:HNH endonuclease [Planctomycetota bacterium]
MCHNEQMSLQRGMNFRVRAGKAGYSIFLMSVRKGAPYQDHWHDEAAGGPHAGMLEYEGHDAPKNVALRSDPKKIDQPQFLPSGKPTDNGKFYQAAMAAKAGAVPEVVQVYEKIADGRWCDRGRYLLVDAEIKTVPISTTSKKTRKVFRFFLKPTVTPAARTREEERELSISRQIPTAIKIAVWNRDRGKCVQCGSTDNLHFDHDVPHSKGGSSFTEANVKILCARHNLEKSDKILSLGPLLGPLVVAATASMLRGA